MLTKTRTRTRTRTRARAKARARANARVGIKSRRLRRRQPPRRLSGRVNARLARPTELKVRLKLGGKVAPETLIARDPKQRRRCGGTLIVAPTALVRHWRDELLRRAGGAGRAADEVTKKLCCLHDAYGFMFFDLHGREWGNNIESDRPPDVLVVSEERLSREFRSVTKKRYSLDDDAEDAADQSPLLKHAWRRVIVDEGRHAGDTASTNRLRLLSALTVGSRVDMQHCGGSRGDGVTGRLPHR